MPVPYRDLCTPFERGVVIISFDTEQIWGHLDILNEVQFQRRYPDAVAAHSKLLACLAQAGISATWFMVGGMTLKGCQGATDTRMARLPSSWIAKIPAGSERTAPLWYRHSFVEDLRKALPHQDIGLHGGLTHLIWTDPEVTREVAEWELAEGVKALEQAAVRPVAFSFGREQECYYDLLPAHGFRCYRGRTVAPAFQLGPTVRGKMARLLDEVRRATPLLVWPEHTLPHLWNIPASLFLYPIHPSRTFVAGLRSRVERFRRGVEAAAHHRGIFHFCLHPENLTESRQGFAMLEEMLESLTATRESGDIEILTMADVAARMEAIQSGHLRNGTSTVTHSGDQRVLSLGEQS